jgi:Tol biopolymer transport system component
MNSITRTATTGVAVVAAAAIGVLLSPAAADAAKAAPKVTAKATPTIAYLRGGDIYLATGTTQKALTTDHTSSRPRWSPDGRRIAYLSASALWTMNADGSAKRKVAPAATGGAGWSPDGRWLAFPGPDCNGTLDVMKVSSTGGTPVSLLPTSPCGTRPGVADGIGGIQTTGGTLAQRMKRENGVAWSPDGKRIAFRGGDCASVFDDCLTVATIATGAETALDGYGGGTQVFSGFGVVPAWSPDGARLSWTAYTDGESGETSVPVHVTESTATGTNRRTVGVAEDRELTYVNAGQALLTSSHAGGSWVTLVDLSSGARTYLRQGSQATAKP